MPKQGRQDKKYRQSSFSEEKNHGRKSEKVFCGALAILSLTLFASCDPGHDYYDLEELKVRVELVDYENPDRRRFFSRVPDHSEELAPLDMSRLEIIETLDEARVGSFLEDLSLCTILSKYYAYDSPEACCIRLVYKDGTFDLLTADYRSGGYSGYIGTYSPDGEVVDFIGCFCDLSSFETLVETYFVAGLR